MHHPVYLLAFLILRAVHGDEDLGLCCLCSGCGPPIRYDEKVDDKGNTCGLLAMQMADPTNDSSQGQSNCQSLQNLHYDRCCNADFDPDPIAQAPTLSPGSKFEYGPYAPCNLCLDGSLPTIPNALTAVVGIPGTPTCKDLYWIAKRGNIEGRMCRPMQNYFQSPCGCVKSTGSSTTNNGGGAAPDQDAPVPAPTYAIPPKQPVPDSNKDDEKLYESDTRGNLNRKRKLAPKGQTLRGTTK